MPETLTITLPWPSPVLWPNSRAHWAKKTGPRKLQKRDAYFTMMDVGGIEWRNKAFESVTIEMTFHPSTNKRFDRDNAQSAMKAAIDGISLFMGIDDSKFKFSSERGEPIEGGCVVISVHGVEILEVK